MRYLAKIKAGFGIIGTALGNGILNLRPCK